MLKIFKNKKAIIAILSIILVVYALRIFDRAIFVAMYESIDMQWYPAMQFFGFIGNAAQNPYEAYLETKMYFLSQVPNYLHLLYILMYPFAKMDFIMQKCPLRFLIHCVLLALLLCR